MIIEDDMSIAFDIDYKAFIKELPDNFGIVQLFTINHVNTKLFVDKYKSDNIASVPWEPHHWGTGGYLVNKRVFEKALAPLLSKPYSDVFDLDLFAADNVTRLPSICFKNEAFQPGLPCVLSRFMVPGHGMLGGVSADYFIYSLVPGTSYTSAVPLLQGSRLAYNSTISERHSIYDRISIDTGRRAIHDMYYGQLRLPSYLKLNAFEIYYIASSNNKNNSDFTDHLYNLGYPFFKVEPILSSDLLHSDFNISDAHYPCHVSHAPLVFASSSLAGQASLAGQPRVQVNQLCVPPTDTLADLAQTLAHLRAILAALDSANTNNYALIMEDRMAVAVDIELQTFIDIFPPDFAFIQVLSLVVS